MNSEWRSWIQLAENKYQSFIHSLWKIVHKVQSKDKVTVLIHTLCLKKTAQLWNGIARNCNDRFWWYLAEIFKSL